MATEDKQRACDMGDREGSSPAAMQRGQNGNAGLFPQNADNGRRQQGRSLKWKQRAYRTAALCLLILVLSLGCAIVMGKPIPETASHILGLFVQVLLGGL